MYSLNEYAELKKKYSFYSSWAIWDYSDPFNTEVIDNNVKDLHSQYVLVGLNISRVLGKVPWSNFHDNTHARKLRYACNKSYLRGSYITDLFKDLPEPVSSKLDKHLSNSEIEENINIFCNEMKDVKLNIDSQFIIFGKMAGKYFSSYFNKYFKNEYKIVRHYSDFRMSDESWVDKFWKDMNIIGDPRLTIMEYKTDGTTYTCC